MTQLFDLPEARQDLPQPAFHPAPVQPSFSNTLTVAGLFAGIGGLEAGFRKAGVHAELLCESWAPAQAVLGDRFPDARIVGDVRDLRSLPRVDVLTAGFPCTDLSLAGRMRGITGVSSGLVSEVFRLLRRRRVSWVVLENVRNMLVLDRGEAMRFLVSQFEELGYRWAYRVVDSRFTGVPQRRQRVIIVATRVGDPSEVLFADEAGERPLEHYQPDVAGFYWTEGFRGLGWAADAVPTLKGGSTIGIPSPPAIWNPMAPSGRRLVVPSIINAEQMQGFEPDWTKASESVSRSRGTRWKLIGNAVTVGVSAWLARRLVDPGPVVTPTRELKPGAAWPLAAKGAKGRRWTVDASMWPEHRSYVHLSDLVDLASAKALSLRAAAGFYDRATRGKLNFVDGFLDDVANHIHRSAAA